MDLIFIGGDGIERNTWIYQNYVLNLLGGKEWKIRESNFLSVNGKFTILGGTRYTPPDQEASRAVSAVVYQMDKLYDGQWNTNYYLDISLNYKINRPKVSHNFNASPTFKIIVSLIKSINFTKRFQLDNNCRNIDLQAFCKQCSNYASNFRLIK